MTAFRLILITIALLVSACAERGTKTAILIRPQLVPLRLVMASNPEWEPQPRAPMDPAIDSSGALQEESGEPRPAVAASNDDRYCLAEAIYFEARNEPIEGQRAVAAAILNRLRSPEFPHTVCDVVHQPAAAGCQFSWYCDGRSNVPTEPKAWALAQRLADEMLVGPYKDATGGAVYFHSGSAYPANWSEGLRQTAAIGQFRFYR